MKYIVLIHRENNVYWGECPELPGCFSQGDTPEELMSNMKEAVELYLEEQPSVDITPVCEVRELVV